ncbi:MAG: nucleotidyltransferase family protein [Terriglobales bacterium]
MKAMVLAAGLGARLRPLTDDRPKALVEVAGRTLLEITLARLRNFGVGEVIINLHHFADLVLDYLKAHDNFGMRIEISREDMLLDTGGGLKRAGQFFLQDSSSLDEPFLLHNVDVISTIDLKRMLQFHKERRALATLAVQARKTSRYLLFDQEGKLCGRRSGGDGEIGMVRPSLQPQALAFGGIHVISPRMIPMMVEEGAFSIIVSYLRLAAQNENILGFRADEYYWRDLGRLEDLQQAARDFEQRILSQ